MGTTIDWYYFRSGCKTCGKTESYIEQRGLEIVDSLNAKAKLGVEDALVLVGFNEEMYDKAFGLERINQ